ncbi:MAG: hypothetical protein JSU87_15205 [Gemmatimonadota bacterium]|nr:MAG: hypothetical protein JSU87_15205 [Gemmatimonadota bacterium]
MTLVSYRPGMIQPIDLDVAGARIVWLGYDLESGYCVIELEGGTGLLISADYEGYHILCEPISDKEVRPTPRAIAHG